MIRRLVAHTLLRPALAAVFLLSLFTFIPAPQPTYSRSFLTAPAAITSVSIVQTGDTWAQLSWSASTGASYYEVCESDAGYPSDNTTGWQWQGTGTTANITGLNSGVSWYFSVFPVAVSGALTSRNYHAENAHASTNTTWDWGDIEFVYYNPAEEAALNTFLETAANTVRDYINLMGGSVSVNTTAPASPGINFSVNATMLAAYGDEAFRFVVDSNGVTITGKTARAVEWGANYLLDEKLGVRWYFRHLDWKIIPASLVYLGSEDNYHSPDYYWRRVIAGVISQNTTNYGEWMRYNRNPGAYFWEISHTYEDILKYAVPAWEGWSTAVKLAWMQANQEWFLPNPLTTLDNGFQLNPNHATVQEMSGNYTDYILTVDVGYYNGIVFTRKSVGISPRDAGLFSPYTNTVTISDMTANITDVIADSKAAANPGVKFGVYNYKEYSDIYTMSFSDNVVIVFTTLYYGAFSGKTMSERIDGITNAGASLGVYDYLNVNGRYTPYSPDMARRVAWFSDKTVDWYEGENADQWGGSGLNTWLVSKLLWDADLDVDVLVTDFFDTAFGDASATMRKYYQVRDDDDEYSHYWAMYYLNQALGETTDEDVETRIRQLIAYEYFTYKWYTEGRFTLTGATWTSSLSSADTQAFYTACSKMRDLWIFHWGTDNYYSTGMDHYEVADPIRYVLKNTHGLSEVQINNLRDFTEPTAEEITAYYDEVMADLAAYTDDPIPVNVKYLTLEALGNTDNSSTEVFNGGYKDILVQAAAAGNITIDIVTGGEYDIDFCNTIGLTLDTFSGSTSTSHNFTAPAAGTYIIRQRNTDHVGATSIDVPSRPAAIVAQFGLSLAGYEETGGSTYHNSGYWPDDCNAPEWNGNTPIYFYVPASTGNFTLVYNCTHASFGVSGYLSDSSGNQYSFSKSTVGLGTLTVSSPESGLWKLYISGGLSDNYFYFIGIPGLIWHDPEYLLVEAS